MGEQRVGLNRSAPRVREHGRLGRDVKRLDRTQAADEVREQLNRPPGARCLRVAILPQVTRTANVNPSAVKVYVLPLKSRRLRRPRTSPEERAKVDGICQMHADN